jgi:hypothetical protein
MGNFAVFIAGVVTGVVGLIAALVVFGPDEPSPEQHYISDHPTCGCRDCEMRRRFESECG